MAATAPGKFGGKALSDELRKLARMAHDTMIDGETVTREQALAAMIWRQALGWTEEKRDDAGVLRKIDHPPVAWCQQFLFERTEGKAAVATVEPQQGMKAADKVRELAKQRVNALLKPANA